MESRKRNDSHGALRHSGIRDVLVVDVLESRWRVSPWHLTRSPSRNAIPAGTHYFLLFSVSLLTYAINHFFGNGKYEARKGAGTLRVFEKIYTADLLSRCSDSFTPIYTSKRYLFGPCLFFFFTVLFLLFDV